VGVGRIFVTAVGVWLIVIKEVGVEVTIITVLGLASASRFGDEVTCILEHAPRKKSVRIEINDFCILELYSFHLLLISGCAKLALWLKIPC
jgi:hypothetical protein